MKRYSDIKRLSKRVTTVSQAVIKGAEYNRGGLDSGLFNVISHLGVVGRVQSNNLYTIVYNIAFFCSLGCVGGLVVGCLQPTHPSRGQAHYPPAQTSREC